ncbi:G/U mismatch-specific DNA glycosylase [Niveomyces insectorum RCEF 264]|uniref:G/U mismatch-specific DNA glycosylase n=1 Tax=Niveomyces insectorum RCEF 264 TaxID=1081102 RepID=A0A167VLI8_9HYPO|nr:G/U mismatch-specific DNA glycosylase [Niveomyces insectorum RCEF 264]
MADDSPLPTFAGRLRVADFMYRGGDDAGSPSPVRVLRSSSSSSRSTSASAAPPRPAWRASPRKRRTADEPDPDPDAKTEEEVDGALPAAADPVLATAPSPSPSPRKKSRSRAPSAYAPPATYAHLPPLQDALGPNLLVLFVGLNPGIETARTGHAYAHPSNLFWKLLYRSGVLPVPCRFDEDRTLPARFRLGLTNIVRRPTRNGAELRPAELDAGVAVLEDKARRWRPAVVCLVGKGIWDSIVRVRYGPPGKRKKKKDGDGDGPFKYGWQGERENMGVLGPQHDPGDVAEGVEAAPGWRGARVFVAASTSGLAATLSPAEKEAIWAQLGAWVAEKRAALEAASGQPWR